MPRQRDYREKHHLSTAPVGSVWAVYWVRRASLLSMALLAGCTAPSHPTLGPSHALETSERIRRDTAAEHLMLRMDSVDLERTGCGMGDCPSYVVRIERGGHVRFWPARQSGSRPLREDRVAPAAAEELFSRASLGELGLLPDTIARVPAYCAHRASDDATVILHLSAGASAKIVVDYQGCAWAPESLRRFESAVDSVAGTQRWLAALRPIFVVDGQIIPDGPQAGNDIDPDLIVNVKILNGDDAARLYGERARAGAIVITTRRSSRRAPKDSVRR